MSKSNASGPNTTDKAWREQFMLRLRVLDVPGPVVGEQLKLVDTHLADSGQSAQEAFGDATAYADSLDLTVQRTPSVALVAIGLGAFIGMGLVAGAMGAFITGAFVPITVGSAALALSVCVIVVAMMQLSRRIGRFGLCMALMVLFIIGVAIITRAIPQIVLVALPAWLALLCGVGLVGSVFYSLRRTIGNNRIVDPITGKSMF